MDSKSFEVKYRQNEQNEQELSFCKCETQFQLSLSENLFENMDTYPKLVFSGKEHIPHLIEGNSVYGERADNLTA